MSNEVANTSSNEVAKTSAKSNQDWVAQQSEGKDVSSISASSEKGTVSSTGEKHYKKDEVRADIR